MLLTDANSKIFINRPPHVIGWWIYKDFVFQNINEDSHAY